MNREQFLVVATLLRMRENTVEAASMVLLDGFSQAHVARLMGMSTQAVGAAVRRIQGAHHMIEEAYRLNEE